MTKLSQEDRLLRALEKAGHRGLTSADFSGVKGTPDGLGPMPRFARALHKLRADGHNIIDVKDADGEQLKRDKCNVVRLVPERAPLAAVPDAEPIRLFAPPAQNAIGDAA